MFILFERWHVPIGLITQWRRYNASNTSSAPLLWKHDQTDGQTDGRLPHRLKVVSLITSLSIKTYNYIHKYCTPSLEEFDLTLHWEIYNVFLLSVAYWGILVTKQPHAKLACLAIFFAKIQDGRQILIISIYSYSFYQFGMILLLNCIFKTARKLNL